jgi:hypothetical protein
MSRNFIAAFVFLLTVAASSFAPAQRFGGLGTSGFGSSGFGGSGLGSSSFGNSFGSSLGGSGFGSSSFGNSGFGSSGFGASGLGSSFGSGFGGMGGFGNSGFGGNSFGNSVGGQGMGNSYGGGQNFVGRDPSDMARTFNQMGQASTQFFNSMNRSMSRNNNSQTAAEDAKVENVKPEMRVQLQVAFTPPRPAQAVFVNNIRTRLSKVLAPQQIVVPQLTMEGDVAVIRGVAATESQRLVLQNLVALEPGVREVRNEMTVAGATATAASPARN